MQAQARPSSGASLNGGRERRAETIEKPSLVWYGEGEARPRSDACVERSSQQRHETLVCVYWHSPPL